MSSEKDVAYIPPSKRTVGFTLLHIKNKKNGKNNTSVMNSIENASITVKSPSGRTVILYKKHLGRKATEEMKDVFWRCANNPMEAFIGEVELTIEEMKVVLAMSKL